MEDRRWLIAATVIAIAAALSIAYASNYGSKTQLTYLVEPLRLARPELYRNDWLVTHTTAYHPVFSWLAAWLFRIDDDGAVAFFVAQLVVSVATYVALYYVVTTLVSRGALALFAVIAAWLALTEGRALAGSYLWSGYLQPSSLATLGWLITLAAWLRGRTFVAGVALACAGALHVNFLVLGVGLFAATELATHPLDWRRVALLVVPQLLVLVWFVPDLTAGADDPDLALRILEKFHAPGHYDPHRITPSALALLAWSIAAWAALPIARPLARTTALDRLWRFAWIASASCLVAAAVIWIPCALGLTRLFVWRIGPFAQLACQLVAAIAVIAVVEQPARLRLVPRWRRVVLAAAIVAIVAQRHIVPPREAYIVLAMAALIMAAARALPAAVRDYLPTALAVVSCAIATGHRRAALFDPRVAAAIDPMTMWARQATAVDALFLTPPAFGRFRLLARRAVVADTWSPPLIPDELVAWYRRLCRVVDIPDAATHEEIERRWTDVTGPRRLAIARYFGADYLAVERSAPAIAAPIAFDGDRYFVVYRVER